ncbi:MAG: hypothetical protein CVU78_00650 [Elusimicrobia bacterium HGW-Elusimicrobia-2]|nr:MAG: hypothetical protein CVU78_00650 [Elusimicrobia bacterium HGW-Elusimicrobia-2]
MKKLSFFAAVKSAGFGAAVVCLIAFQSSALGFLTNTVETPSAQTLGHGIIELGGGAGVYKPANSDTYSNDKNAWGNFGVTERLEGGLTLYTSTMAAANIKLLLIKGGKLPSLAVGVNNITGKTKETFATGAPGDTAVSNSAYCVISQDLKISGSVLTISAGRGNRGFVDKTGDYKNLHGAFAGLKLNAGQICAAVEEDGRDVNCSLAFNFPTGMSVGANARNLKENFAPKVFGVFLNFSNTMIEQRITSLEAKIKILSGETAAVEASKISAERIKTYFMEGHKLFSEEKYPQSIEFFEKVLEQKPGHAEAAKYLKTAKIKTYFMEGHKLFSEKKYTQSIKFFEKVIDLSPGHAASEDYIKRARTQLKQ